MNNNTELAIKFGVPTFKTCEKLDWKEETLFTWYSVEGKQFLALTTELKNSNLYEDVFYAAPQMHEIAAVLPKLLYLSDQIEGLLYQGKRTYPLIMKAISQERVSLSYFLDGEGFSSSIGVVYEEDNYAEAYAKLYLLLKEKQLLK